MRVESLFQATTAPLPKQAKFFLVAGSSQSANFAQEIVDQKSLWLKAGYNDDEIACYYVVPYQREFEHDRKQFLALAPKLADCYPANMKLLRRHLKQAVRDGTRPPFLYLYVTAHGEQPDDTDPILDQYRLKIEALPSGTVGESQLLKAYHRGMNPRDIYLTPKYLSTLLRHYYREIPKFIVLQGCYSGGFAEALNTLPNLTILTAARHDRTSFGCQSGVKTTYYGGTFNQQLKRHLDSPLQIDWEQLHQNIGKKISRKEAREKELQPSLPVFLSN